MLVRRLTHSWDLSEGEARLRQEELAATVETHDRLSAPIQFVAGVDVAYDAQSERLFAAGCVT